MQMTLFESLLSLYKVLYQVPTILAYPSTSALSKHVFPLVLIDIVFYVGLGSIGMTCQWHAQFHLAHVDGGPIL